MRRFCVAAVVVALACPASASAAGRWVTSFQASPHSADGLDWRKTEADRPEGFRNQTLRSIATPHATGAKLRIGLERRQQAGPLSCERDTSCAMRR